MIPLFEVPGPDRERESASKPGGVERCRRCKRLLTDEESLGFHVGPVCRERLGIARPKREARPARWRPGGRWRPPDTQPELIIEEEHMEETTDRAGGDAETATGGAGVAAGAAGQPGAGLASGRQEDGPDEVNAESAPGMSGTGRAVTRNVIRRMVADQLAADGPARQREETRPKGSTGGLPAPIAAPALVESLGPANRHAQSAASTLHAIAVSGDLLAAITPIEVDTAKIALLRAHAEALDELAGELFTALSDLYERQKGDQRREAGR